MSLILRSAGKVKGAKGSGVWVKAVGELKEMLLARGKKSRL